MAPKAALAGLLQADGGPSLNGVGSIATHMLLPFLAGQSLQHWLDGWMQRRRQVLGWSIAPPCC